jgi:uncharacterized protein (TIGR02452 family)
MYNGKISKEKEERIKVFEDTKNLVKTNEVIKESLRKSVEGQILIKENESIEAKMPACSVNKDRYTEEAEIKVSKKRTFEAASAYPGKKVCVLNFASASNPGGGVERGAGAQEECLCRVSTLYFCLNTPEMWDGFYTPHRAEHNPLHNNDIIFTPDVTVFKTDTAMPERMKESEWYDVDIITCAAPNLRQLPSNQYNPGDGKHPVKILDSELFSLHFKRFKRILDVAVASGAEVIILGAFGCGAFQNDPKVVAKAAKDIIEEYRNSLETIEFAVYCRDFEDENYQVFRSVFA